MTATAKNAHWKKLLDFLLQQRTIPVDYQGKLVLELNVSQGGVTDARITKTEKF